MMQHHLNVTLFYSTNEPSRVMRVKGQPDPMVVIAFHDDLRPGFDLFVKDADIDHLIAVLEAAKQEPIEAVA